MLRSNLLVYSNPPAYYFPLNFPTGGGGGGGGGGGEFSNRPSPHPRLFGSKATILTQLIGNITYDNETFTFEVLRDTEASNIIISTS